MFNYDCSYEPDDVVFEKDTPSSPKQFDNTHRDLFASHQIKQHRGSADQTSYHASEMTPDSPVSQVQIFSTMKISDNFYNYKSLFLHSLQSHFLYI